MALKSSFLLLTYLLLGFPSGTRGKGSACQCRRPRRWFDPWVGKIPWRRGQQSTPVFLPGESWTEEPGGLRSMELQRGTTESTQPACLLVATPLSRRWFHSGDVASLYPAEFPSLCPSAQLEWGPRGCLLTGQLKPLDEAQSRGWC